MNSEELLREWAILNRKEYLTPEDEYRKDEIDAELSAFDRICEH